METVADIQHALEKIPWQEKWEIAQWLLNELHSASLGTQHTGNRPANRPVPPQPDYQARRREVFGDKVLPNMVLLARDQERW